LTIDRRLLIRHGICREHPTIRVFELATGQERLRIVAEEKERTRFYTAVALSPDGRTLATASEDNMLKLWELGTGREILRVSGYTESVHSMTFSPSGRHLATGHADGMIHVWDVSTSTRAQSHMPLAAKEVDSWWRDLADADAAKAHKAIWNLIEVPEPALGLLQDRLRPAADRSQRIADLIAQLDDARFAAREAASKELESLGAEAEPALRRALDLKPTAEKRRRILKILDRPWLLVQDPEILRGIRAIEILEHIAGRADATRPIAMNLLKKLAGGAASARLTQDAIATLQRLETRKP